MEYDRLKLYSESHGSDQPVLVVLHGLSGNGAVWDGFVERMQSRFRGRLIVPDLRGHGRSFHGTHYGYGNHASDVAKLLSPNDEVYVVGHSMGGVVAAALATGWFGLNVAKVLALATKISFSEAELSKINDQAQAPVRNFATRKQAAARLLKVSGLEGLSPLDGRVVDVGVTSEAGGHRLVADPRTMTVAGPDFGTIFAASACPVILARGANDPLVTLEDLRCLDQGAEELPNLSHNLHVEDPAAVVDFVEEKLF